MYAKLLRDPISQNCLDWLNEILPISCFSFVSQFFFPSRNESDSCESRFNHKTAAEDVHITTESDNDADTDTDTEKEGTNHESDGDHESATHDSHSEGGDSSGTDLELSSGLEDESPFLEIIMIKDVKAGAEVRISFASRLTR